MKDLSDFHKQLGEGAYRQAQNSSAQLAEMNPRSIPRLTLAYEEQIGNKPEKAGPRLALAGFLLSLGEVDAALLEFEELLDFDPKNVEAYNFLGRVYIKQEKIDEAIALLEQSIAEGVKDVSLTETLAAAYLEKGRINDAVKFYEEIIAQKPGDKQTLRILGELYTRLEEFNKAASCYQLMFSDDPEVGREVIKRLEELLKKVEGNVEIRETLSDIYMKALNPEAAVAKLQEIIRLESSKADEVILKLKNTLKNYPNLPAAMLALAEALFRKGLYSEAAENFAQLFKAKPGYIDEIIAGYRRILEVCPEQVLARLYLGEALLDKNQVIEAISEFGEMVEADPAVAGTTIRKCREVLKDNPKLSQAHVVLGKAFLAKGEFQRGAAEAEGVIAVEKNSTAAYCLLGEAYSKLNLPRKATQALRTALVLEPYNIHIHEKYREARLREVSMEISAGSPEHLNLAKLYLAKGEKGPAVKELLIAQKDRLRAASASNLLGNLYRAEGRYDLAGVQYEKALETAVVELTKTIRFNLGTVQEALGQVRKAIKIYEGIVQEEPASSGLKKKVKQLKATTLTSLRNFPLQMVIAEYGRKELVGLWGRDPRPAMRAGHKEEVVVSFGHEHNLEGFDFFMKGMYPAAEEAFSLAVQLDRNFSVALNNLGVTLARQGKFDEARSQLSSAVQTDPASAIFHNNLGVVGFLLGKTESAKVDLEKARLLDPEAAAICLNLGDLYYFRREAAEALKLYQQVGDYDPLTDLASERLMYKIP